MTIFLHAVVWEGWLVFAFFMRLDRPGLLFQGASFASGLDASPSLGTILVICPALVEMRCIVSTCTNPHAGGENSACILINSRLRGAVDRELGGEYIRRFPPNCRMFDSFAQKLFF